MNICYLGLGSNQKNPERQIRTAIKSIKNLSSTYVIKTSKLYWTKAWGVSAQQDFCNVVIEVATCLPPHLLLKKCQQIELKHQRIRRKRWGPRTLDIDLLLYGNKTIKNHELVVPHPYMTQRDFVLMPLTEINPQIQLPI